MQALMPHVDAKIAIGIYALTTSLLLFNMLINSNLQNHRVGLGYISVAHTWVVIGIVRLSLCDARGKECNP